MWFFVLKTCKSFFLQMTRWKKWKALNEINENRCPRPMTSELLSRFENYQVIWIRTARECKNFKCRNVFGRHLLEILSRMYIHVYKYCKSGIVEINVYYMYIVRMDWPCKVIVCMSADIKVTYSREVSTIWHMPVNVALCSSQKMFNQRHIEDPDW